MARSLRLSCGPLRHLVQVLRCACLAHKAMDVPINLPRRPWPWSGMSYMQQRASPRTQITKHLAKGKLGLHLHFPALRRHNNATCYRFLGSAPIVPSRFPTFGLFVLRPCKLVQLQYLVSKATRANFVTPDGIPKHKQQSRFSKSSALHANTQALLSLRFC